MAEKARLSIQNNFSIIYRHGRMLHDRAMREFGLSGPQMGYLRFIAENPGVSQEEIASCMRIDKGAVAKAIKDMMERGYLRREQNPEDRRAYCLYTADKAEQICINGRKEAARVENMITGSLTDEELETFARLLEKITENLTQIMKGDDNR